MIPGMEGNRSKTQRLYLDSKSRMKKAAVSQAIGAAMINSRSVKKSKESSLDS